MSVNPTLRNQRSSVFSGVFKCSLVLCFTDWVSYLNPSSTLTLLFPRGDLSHNQIKHRSQTKRISKHAHLAMLRSPFKNSWMSLCVLPFCLGCYPSICTQFTVRADSSLKPYGLSSDLVGHKTVLDKENLLGYYLLYFCKTKTAKHHRASEVKLR